MENYKGMSSERKMVETFYLIKRGRAGTKKELSDIVGVDVRTIGNYITKLRNDWGVDIEFDSSRKRYKIYSEGFFKQLSGSNGLKAEDVHLILSMLNKTYGFAPDKVKLIRERLLDLLSKDDIKILRNLFFRDLGDIKYDSETSTTISAANDAIFKGYKI